ncbi:MAG TPA: hypothetical protein VGR35_12860 [Tepidisphaeraceae bacterium]|nr:hypothetical protein [Tepidisphaeraceae bacterium]
MDTSKRDQQQHWEHTVRSRLARLRSMPVDAGRLEKALRAQIPRPDSVSAAAALSWLRPMRAVAASILVIITVVTVLLLSTASRPVSAAPAHMAEMHQNVVSGRVPVVQVDSIAQANEVLSRKWSNLPEVPDVPENHIMACCMQSLKDKKIACVLMKRDGVPVTLMVAHAKDMRAPDSPVTVKDGVRFHVQAVGELNMVMTQRRGRWACLIGELPAETLMDVVQQLEF